MDRLGFLLIVLILLLCGACGYSLYHDKHSAVMTEEMAPLNEGTFINRYPRGGCNRGSFKRSDCEVGTCPLGTTVTDTRYCGIQCAQEPDRKDKRRCEKDCMNMMVNCH